MVMNTTESRREFEEWATTQEYNLYQVNGEYDCIGVSIAWEAWQAPNA